MTVKASGDGGLGKYIKFKRHSIQEVGQQGLGEHLDDDEKTKLEKSLARACVPHCIAAAKEIMDWGPYERTIDKLLGFIDEYGPGAQNEESEYYSPNKGWKLVPLAEDLRKDGKWVVVQNLNYPAEDTDIDKMVEAGRVTNDVEIRIMQELKEWGGADKAKWAGSIRHTIRNGAMAIPIISIPRNNGSGAGGHAVLVEAISDDDVVKYFDPDAHALDRYEDNGMAVPGIEQIEGTRMFEQPMEAFCERMTGEVIHII